MISSNLLDGAWCISTHIIMLYMYEGIDQSVWKWSRTYRAMSESIFFNDICKGPSDALALKRPISLMNASRVPREKNPSEIRCKSYLSHWSLKHANTRAPSSNVSSNHFHVLQWKARRLIWPCENTPFLVCIVGIMSMDNAGDEQDEPDHKERQV